MGLRQHIAQQRYVWRWRLRYWWMDTESGQKAHIALFVVMTLATVVQLVNIVLRAPTALRPGAPVQSVADWVVYLIILIISALISYALRPKPEGIKPQQEQAPTTEEGRPVLDIHGTCWLEHEEMQLLAAKIVGRDPIKSKAGK